MIFESAQRDAYEVTALRRSLDLDAGYLSPILSRLDGLIHRDARRLRAHGRRAAPGFGQDLVEQTWRLKL